MPAQTAVIASDKTKLKFVPVKAVKLREGFWRTKLDTNHRTSLPELLGGLEEHGVVDNFMIVSGRKKVERKGPYFSDSDLFKWMEGAAWDLANYDDPARKAELDKVIDEVVAAQGEDGYLNTFFQGDLFKQRFRDLGREHELYCAGHMFQAAIAHYRVTGEDKFLNCATRYADYLVSQFGPGKREEVDGHPEIEMALIELYRETGKKAYLDLAGFFLSILKYPERKSLEGHAVRAMYTCCGGADYFAETGDESYNAASLRLWDDLTQGKLYVTGGFGSRHWGEATGMPYELPNLYAYAETCAAIANAMWQYRMLGLTGEARYADEMERALYNGVISGVSLDGSHYFYVNPLANAGTAQRQPWFGCTCCPTNMVRMMASVPGYMYSVSNEGLWVHLFDSSTVDYKLADGTRFTLDQQTEYPWDGNMTLKLGLDAPKEFTLFVRIPGWCSSAAGTVNGAEIAEELTAGEYHAIKRTWKPGDTIHFNFGMPVSLRECDPRVRENYGDVAVQRGPLVYCIESIDNPDLSALETQLTSDDFVTSRSDLLGGVTLIKGSGTTASPSRIGGPLYRREADTHRKSVPVTLVPYYAWANRGPAHMTVWLPMGDRR